LNKIVVVSLAAFITRPAFGRLVKSRPMGIPIGPFPGHQIEIRVAEEFAGYWDLLAFTTNLRGEGDASNEILLDRPGDSCQDLGGVSASFCRIVSRCSAYCCSAGWRSTSISFVRGIGLIQDLSCLNRSVPLFSVTSLVYYIVYPL
jgi:hypothetical protein